MDIHNVKSKLEHNMKKMKLEVGTLFYASKNPNTPILAKLITVIVVGYALSPIDLIPDFIPVLGYLDDLILLPLGIALAIKLIPVEVMDESRIKAIEYFGSESKRHYLAAIVIIFIWILIISFIVIKIMGFMGS